MNERAENDRRAFVGMAIAAAAGVAVGPAESADAPEQSKPGSAEPLAKQPSYLVVYKPGPAWLVGKPVAEQPLREHGRYMLDLYGKGLMKMAGSFADDTGGAAVIDAADVDAAHAIVAQDPAVVRGIMTYELHPWRLVAWDRLLKR